MIKLFASDATVFTSLGISVLKDASSALVTEERNGGFELEIKYPIKGSHYSDIALRNIIVCKASPFNSDSGTNGPQAFRIYNISKPFNGIVTVKAEHISYDLTGIPVNAFKATSLTNLFASSSVSTSILANAAAPCPFSFDSDISSDEDFEVLFPKSIRSLLGGSSDTILEIYGGEYKFDNYTISLKASRGENRGVVIKYGKNLTDLKQEENCSSVFTGIYPYYYKAAGTSTTSNKGILYYLDDGTVGPKSSTGSSAADGTVVTIASVNGGSPILNASGTFNFTKIQPVDLSSYFSETPSATDLLSKAQEYLTKNDIGIPKVNLDVSFVDLSKIPEYSNFSLLQRIYLCDTVKVEFEKLGVSTSAKAIKTVYDVINDRYDSITLSSDEEKVGTLTSVIAKQSETISQLPTTSTVTGAVDSASKFITGGLGGYACFHSSIESGGLPDEILIMDKEKVSEATQVWRWNKFGLGFSSNGYGGPYGLAITSDGKIVADFIQSGHLDGSLITAESIESGSISQTYKNEVEQAFTIADGLVKSEIKGTTDGLSTQISNLIQNYNSFILSYTNRYSGGINYLKNSSGLNGLSNDWTVTGSINALQTGEALTKTVSGSMFVFDSGAATLSQTVSVLARNSYTITVKAKITEADAGCSLYMDNGGNIENVFSGTEFQNGWIEYSLTIEASSTSIIVYITSSENSIMYIADLMLAEGTVKQRWTSAPNEIYTTNVKIDRRGINITNDDSDTQTIIDNTQFAILHDDSVVLTVNKDLTRLKKTNISDEMTIGKGKFDPIDSGLNFILLD
jgi:phage minor structural protein